MYSLRVSAWLGSDDMIDSHLLNPYGLAKYTVLIVAVSLVLLVPLDWAFPSGTRAMQLGVKNAERAIPQFLRGGILFLLLLYIGWTGWDPGAYGFIPGRAMFLLTTYMFLSVFLYPSDVSSRLLSFIKSLSWIVAAIASYRLALGGQLSVVKIRYLAGSVVIVASAYTIPFCLDSNRSIGQNANGGLLLWCIPLLLLVRPPRWAVGLSGLASVSILLTVKRGTILALLIGGCAYSILLIYMSNRDRKARDCIVILLAMAVVVSGLCWQWENIENRMQKDFDRGVLGSGRSAFYSVIVGQWYNGTTFSFLFGNGFFTVQETLDAGYGERIYAHSDWLQILHDMGVLGIVLFAYLHWCMLSVVVRSLRQRHVVAPALMMGYCVFTMRNIYSQVVVGNSTNIYFGILLGHAAAAVQAQQESECCIVAEPWADEEAL